MISICNIFTIPQGLKDEHSFLGTTASLYNLTKSAPDPYPEVALLLSGKKKLSLEKKHPRFFDQFMKTPSINAQFPITALIPMPINTDHCQSIPINQNWALIKGVLIYIAIDRHWALVEKVLI